MTHSESATDRSGLQTHREPDGAASPHGHAHDVPEHGEVAHDGEPLGPIDSRAWVAAIIGIGLGLLVALTLVVSNGG